MSAEPAPIIPYFLEFGKRRDIGFNGTRRVCVFWLGACYWLLVPTLGVGTHVRDAPRRGGAGAGAGTGRGASRQGVPTPSVGTRSGPPRTTRTPVQEFSIQGCSWSSKCQHPFSTSGKRAF